MKAASAITCLLVALLSLLSFGCALALHPVMPASEERVRLVAPSPGQYSIRTSFDFDQRKDYPVPADGRLILFLPSYRPPCGMYIFKFRVGGGRSGRRSGMVTVLRGNEAIRTLSWEKFGKLNVDPDGFRVLTLR
jgi:hypothetical protein